MNKKSRRSIVAGNWKMNLLPSQVQPFGEELKALAAGFHRQECVVCVPFVMLPAALKVFEGSDISVGAQNVSENPRGAYTGEVCADQLRDLGVKYVIIGHSERRTLFDEDDIRINTKVRLALEAGLHVIICVGETAEQRNMDVTFEVIKLQVKSALYGLDEQKLKRVVFAYEPVWAIGTGVTATSDQAEEVCSFIRGVVRAKFGGRIANGLRILYGGSVTPENADDFFLMPDIDGALIGGASLDPHKFFSILEESENNED
ncbi:MAG: triose-phosphate isomerase [Oscillospiraceae bacterium]|nr:triose-phosphate isomerase [Oscillospiraceae bacterium]